MKKLYVLQESFSGSLQQYPHLLDHVSEKQKAYMVKTIDIYDVMSSAASFFQSDIVMDGCMLYMQNSITKACCSIECREDCVLFDEESNPFVDLLKRKYRSFFIKDFDFT